MSTVTPGKEPHPFVPAVHSREAILDEIAWLRSRLKTIGYDGDCAYERAMVKFYGNMLSELLLRLRLHGC